MRLSRGALDLSNGQRYSLDGSEIPFPDLESIQELLPSYARGDDAGAMRDALLNTIRKLANKIWADTGLALNAFVSPRYANGAMLDVWGIIRQRPRNPGETRGAYRDRLLAASSGMTAAAIQGAVLDQVALFPGASVVFQEPANDGEFWTDDAQVAPWDSYYQDTNQILWNTGFPKSKTGGYWAPDKPGAQFWVIIQRGAGSDGSAPKFVADDDSGAENPNGYWADEGIDWGYWAFDGDPLENRIVNEVEARKAFGVAWMLIEDPNLNGAV